MIPVVGILVGGLCSQMASTKEAKYIFTLVPSAA